MTERRSVALALWILTLALFVADPPTLSAQTSGSIFNGTDLTGWKVEHTKADVRDGVVRVENGNGWVRTERPFSDFVLSLDVRVTKKNATAGVYLRGWPTFDRSEAPTNAYRLRLVDGKTLGAAKGEWTHLEIECVGQTVRVRMDGQVVYTADAVGNPQGHVALWSKGGTAEFKGIALRQLGSSRGASPPPNVFMVGGAVTSPRVLIDPKPRYAAEAMRARIAGLVIMSAVVLPDGTVGDVVILQSLDPKFGLDEEAVATAKKWRFAPGTRDGTPVPVFIQIELEFIWK